MQQFTDNTKKRPAATAGFVEELYLRSRVKHQITKVENEALPATRDNWPSYEYLRDLARRLRRPTKQAGKSVWPTIFAAACVCAFIYFAHPWAKTRVYCALPGCTPQISFRVLKSFSQRDFLMQRVVDGVPEPPEVRRFDEKPMFEIGFTLTYLKFEDRGDRWSIKHLDPYFRALRDDNGWPVLPPNCTNAWKKPVVCDGVPKW